ncbi:aldo/keto reductase [Leifsonia sp. L25]|uniref:aldo/keto reductase n=1 Tax=Actinomycetes TaxID=1760 RepID=UPI003D6822D6
MSAPTRRRVGAAGVEVGGLGFGGASLGNLYRETTDAEAAGAVQRAWDRGIRYFDTAPHYGLGLSERRLGATLSGLPREEYVLSTKVGRLLVPNPAPTARDTEGFAVPGDLVRRWDFSREGILASLDASLARLGTDRIDIVYAHDPDQCSPKSAREALETLRDLQRQGVVGAVGVGTNSVEGLKELIDDGLLDVIMLAGRYSLLEQGALDTVLEPAARAGVSVVAVGVFNSGLLSTSRPRAGDKYDYGDAPQELIDRARRLAAICRAYGVELPAAAMAFPLLHPAVVNVTVGLRTAEQVDQNADSFAAHVPDAMWSDLVAEGLLDASAVPIEFNRKES